MTRTHGPRITTAARTLALAGLLLAGLPGTPRTGADAILSATASASLHAQQDPAARQEPERPTASGTLALVGGQLLDGYEAPPIHHAAVVIEGDEIVAVGPASEVEIPAGATVINTAGKTMLPGLIDAHVHIMILGHGEYAAWMPWFEEHEELVYETSAKQLLAAGVTTALDLAAPSSILAFHVVREGVVYVRDGVPAWR